MNKEKFTAIGVSDEQQSLISEHLEKAKKFVFAEDSGLKESFVWLKENLNSHLEKEDADFLYQVALDNMPSDKVEYLEKGYDSCQSHRKLSKIIGEAILLGGYIYESDWINITYGYSDATKLKEAKTVINSTLKLNVDAAQKLSNIAEKYGSEQDFLFPGVTPSDPDTMSLEDMLYASLSGDPQTSVRTVTGVGGLRFDKDWNYVTDIATFADLKVKEDKRYYPGLILFHHFLNLEFENLPKAWKFKDLIKKMKEIKHVEKQGVSVLCSSFIPTWGEMKKLSDYPASGAIQADLIEAFHSPAYDFSVLLSEIKKFNFHKPLERGWEELLEHDAMIDAKQIGLISKKLNHLWTFNSTIHLPWTAALADLSNGLIGRITNQVGDYGIKYGVGKSGKSLEIDEYHFGQQRNFPQGVAGNTGYKVKIYSESEEFKGPFESFILEEGSPLWKSILEKGFLAAALDELEVK